MFVNPISIFLNKKTKTKTKSQENRYINIDIEIQRRRSHWVKRLYEIDNKQVMSDGGVINI